MIEYLLAENSQYRGVQIPESETEQKYLLRSLVNVRHAVPASEEFLHIEDEYLQEEIKLRGITDIADLVPACDDLYIWRGDITTLKVDAIVNAANSGMTGCWQPCHSCIDNCIHTFAGIRLRAACDSIIKKQGHEEPTGQAKITPAFNLPCKFVLHTVGPIVQGKLQKKHEKLLASCYYSCLKLAEENEVKSLAFCCISTGVFMFPNERAAEIAVETIRKYYEEMGSRMRVVFSVFSEKDEEIYRRLIFSR